MSVDTQTPIHIIGAIKTIDNWGREERYDEQETYNILINQDGWNDDIRFYDFNNVVYWIDDLIGKKVRTGPFIFTIQED